MGNSSQQQKESNESTVSSRAAWLFLFTGMIFMLMGTGVIPFEPQAGEAPLWILTLSGGIFFTAGIMMRIGQRSAWNDLLAAVLLLLFGILGAWVAIQGEAEGFSGGIPLLGGAVNLLLARILFGSGSVICFLSSLYAFRIFIRKLKKSVHNTGIDNLTNGGIE